MGRCRGGMILEGELQKLRADLEAYFGMINEMEMGLNPEKVEKPLLLRSLEQCEALNALPYSGGVNDQPYIWLQGVAECRKARDVYAMLRRVSQNISKNLEDSMTL